MISNDGYGCIFEEENMSHLIFKAANNGLAQFQR
jgi:hypothetical protein